MLSEICLTLLYCLSVVRELTVLRLTTANIPSNTVTTYCLDYSLWRIVGQDVCTFGRVMRIAGANGSKHLLLGGQELIHTVLK